MLTSTVIRLTPVEDRIIAPTVGRHAHALFLSLIQQVNPSLSQKLHSPAPVKPFTVSPLQGPFRPVENAERPGISLNSRSSYWMRFTTMSDEVSYTLLACLLTCGPDLTLRVQSAVFRVKEILIPTSTSSPWSGCATWDDIASAAKPVDSLTVRFYSPTTFRQSQGNSVQPLPQLVFGSWWDKWNALSPNPIYADREERNELLASVGITACEISTNMLDFGPFKQVGFVGTVQYNLSHLPTKARWWLNLLARFAFYCGTGAKTTMGMGQTSLVSPQRRPGEGAAEPD